MHKILSLLLSLLFVNVSLAGHRSDSEMFSLAVRQLYGTMAKGSVRVNKVATTQTYSIFSSDNDGYVIVSRNSDLKPILGYSSESYDEKNLPDGFVWWLHEIDISMQYYENNQISLPSSLYSSDLPVVNNFISSVWGQSNPYNQKCPRIGPKTTLTGCAATAMSQILRYYAYPVKGYGTGRYTVEGVSGYKYSTINNTYNWTSMIDSYRRNPTVVQQNAVSTLMFDAGAASHIQYQTDASGAIPVYVASAFVYNFQYDSLALRYCTRAIYTDKEWIGMIYNELSNKRPVFFAAIDSIYGGHAFVFDGIDADGKVHVNWGWDGRCNGYYDIFDLSPKDLFTTSVTYHYNSDQSMIFGYRTNAKPDAGEIDIPEIYTYPKITFAPTQYKDSIDIGIYSFENINYRSFYGKLFLTIKNMQTSNVDTLLFYDTDNNDSGPLDYGYIIRYDTTFVHLNLPLLTTSPGTYQMAFRALPDGETNSTVVRCDTGELYYTMIIAKNGAVSFQDGDPATASISDIKADGSDSSKGIQVYDMSGQLLLHSPGSSLSESDLPAKRVVILRQGITSKKVLR